MKLLLSALAAILFVAACGKKAPLRPPEPEKQENDAASGR